MIMLNHIILQTQIIYVFQDSILVTHERWKDQYTPWRRVQRFCVSPVVTHAVAGTNIRAGRLLVESWCAGATKTSVMCVHGGWAQEREISCTHLAFSACGTDRSCILIGKIWGKKGGREMRYKDFGELESYFPKLIF